MSQNKRVFNPKLSRVRVYNFGGGRRVFFKGFSAKNLARSRRKLHRKTDDEYAELKEIKIAHKKAIVAAGYDPKKHMNIPDDSGKTNRKTRVS